jgi:hypothetical protein
VRKLPSSYSKPVHLKIISNLFYIPYIYLVKKIIHDGPSIYRGGKTAKPIHALCGSSSNSMTKVRIKSPKRRFRIISCIEKMLIKEKFSFISLTFIAC